MSHPYKEFGDRSFWNRSVARNFDAADVVNSTSPLLRPGDRIVSAGSCFAANLVPYLEQAGFNYVRRELTNAVYEELGGEALSYSKFSAAYGNIYTTRNLLQLWQRCAEKWSPQEDRWYFSGEIIDPFRPGLRFRARSDYEYDLITKQHLECTKAAFENCDVFIFTLGLTEAWVSKIDGAVYPACPGTVAGSFDSHRHSFVNFGVREVEDDLRSFILGLRERNPSVRFVLTVSPVPLIATASPNHVLSATTLSKSVLRVAAETVAMSLDDVVYFPSYELVTGSQAPRHSFEDDRRSVSKDAVDFVMAAFLERCEGNPSNRSYEKPNSRRMVEVNEALAELECEEAGQER